jgi:hypothetical protein
VLIPVATTVHVSLRELIANFFVRGQQKLYLYVLYMLSRSILLCSISRSRQPSLFQCWWLEQNVPSQSVLSQVHASHSQQAPGCYVAKVSLFLDIVPSACCASCHASPAVTTPAIVPVSQHSIRRYAVAYSSLACLVFHLRVTAAATRSYPSSSPPCVCRCVRVYAAGFCWAATARLQAAMRSLLLLVTPFCRYLCLEQPGSRRQ